ncbi:hypothetical protein [Arthrobacter sp. MYb222]|uniref:hypothetical protein n=1 Tax=Micrococcaceae TaxID=1268 RepID=UPI000CFB3963|nr:hypothetical protein [Arthrobacter sp. MYb222]PQZ90640.1 hypothetical protein CQ016_01585 [Arthrobacter sp. MYb222]
MAIGLLSGLAFAAKRFLTGFVAIAVGLLLRLLAFTAAVGLLAFATAVGLLAFATAVGLLFRLLSGLAVIAVGLLALAAAVGLLF